MHSPVPSYPAFLRLEGRRVLVVGGGKVAAQKLPALRESAASITVVSPALHPSFLAGGGIEWRARAFEERDLDGVWFVVSAAPPEVNARVARACELRQLFVNAVDDRESASVHLGGVVRKGGVTLAVSTGGRAPALAGLLREALEALLPEEIGGWLAQAEALKARWRAEGVPMEARRPLLLEALFERYQKHLRPHRA
jgi:uroporphyrin-III C-methyltransferase / precorrin-2 dehydrogenase / sirohydrochlorin ferrochelatase